MQNYNMIFKPDEVKIFDGAQTTLLRTEEPILQGWGDPQTGLWWTLLHPGPQFHKTCTYDKNNKAWTNSKDDAIHNVNTLPSTKQIIQYYHTAAGFSKTAT